MGRFADAIVKLSSQEMLERKHNYLCNLLDEGYSAEGLVGSDVLKVKINVNDIIAVYKNDDKIFGVDADGQIFANTISNSEDADVYARIGTISNRQGIFLFKRSISSTTPVMRLLIGSGSNDDPGFHWEYMDYEMMFYGDDTGWIRKVDNVTRESITKSGNYTYIDQSGQTRLEILSDGIFRVKDHNDKTRFYLFADGGIELVDTSGQQVFVAQGGASENVELICKNNQYMKVGVNSTGAYYTHNSLTENYFNDMIGKKIGSSDSAGAGGSTKWLKLATITFASRYAYVASVLKLIGSPSSGGAGYGATLYINVIQQDAFPNNPTGQLYISDCVNMGVGNFVARVTYTAGDATVVEVWAQAVHDYKGATLFLVCDVGSAGKVYTCGSWAASATGGTDLTVTQVD